MCPRAALCAELQVERRLQSQFRQIMSAARHCKVCTQLMMTWLLRLLCAYLVFQGQWLFEANILSANTGDHAQPLGPLPGRRHLCIQLELLDSLQST